MRKLLFGISFICLNILLTYLISNSNKQVKDVSPASLYANVLSILHMNMAKSRSLAKFDEQGNYIQFTGNTIICKLPEDVIAKWSFIHDLIKNDEILSKYYTPLPPSSYHMTIFELFHQGPSLDEDAFQGLLATASPIFKYIQFKLIEEKLLPTSAHIASVNPSGVLCFLVEFENKEELQRIKTFREMASRLTGLSANSNYTFHISLAYLYVRPTTTQEFNEIRKATSSLITKLQEIVKEPIPFLPARVTTYTSMTQFDDLQI